MAAMHKGGHDSGAFRFLDLPAELRSLIYRFYFIPNSHPELELLYICSHVLPSKLTVIHYESQGLYEEARAEVLRNSTFFFTVHHVRNKFRSGELFLNENPDVPKLLRLASRISVYSIIFRVLDYFDEDRNIGIKASKNVDGSTEWRVMLKPSNNVQQRVHQIDQADMIWDLQHNMRIGLSGYGTAREGLDIPLCLEAVHYAW
ncbi:hypothetical protein LTR37_011294 [Vermiconidia calcicola]|uniref:Uncharacterized protein n=1 Tax=Vermiconidia calcicola TaxID=1690605 RepID=A0ACC3N458_9PEZI|nr:hypothetical protein LTR37_011294 [Vermiconidia calcicola]